MTRTPESDSHRYAGARPPGRRRTCPEIVAGAVIAAVIAAVAAIVAAASAVADSAATAVVAAAAAVVATVAAASAAALPRSARANIAVQRFILDAASGIGVGAGVHQETHDFRLTRRPVVARMSVTRHDETPTPSSSSSSSSRRVCASVWKLPGIIDFRSRRSIEEMQNDSRREKERGGVEY